MGSAIRSMWGMARNDLAVWLRSPAAIAASLLPALGMGVLVAVLTNSVGQQPVALVVQGKGRLAARMARIIKADADAYLLNEMNAAEAERAVGEERVAAIIAIPENFDDAAAFGNAAVDRGGEHAGACIKESMKRTILTILYLLLAACSEDPARSVKIVSAHPVGVTTVYTPPPGPDRNLIPEFCPPPEDSPGPGSFAAKGPCEFQQRAPVSCEATGDDLIVAVPRKAKNGASLLIYLNVEHYRGPGVYEGAQIFVAVESGEIIYRWSNDEVRATVGPDEAFVALSSTQLDQEPVRVACSRLIGPESNYTYQCAGTSGAIDSAAEIVSGKLQCRSRGPAQKIEHPHEK